MNRYRTAINRPQTESNMTGGEDVKISDCRVWTEAAKDEEQMCKKKKISKWTECLSLERIIIFLNFFSPISS